MKNIFIGFALFFSVTLFGQVTILEENFDNTTLPAQWTVINNDGNTVAPSVQEYTEAWIYKEDPLNPGNGTVSSTSYFSPVDRADRWLISPAITLGNSGNVISWKGMSFDPSFPDSYKILVSTSGNDISDFTDTLTIVNLQTPYWAKYTETLDEYTNETIHVAFVNTTYDGYKLFLDSIQVREQDPLSVTDEEIKVAVYPNPITDHFVISTGNTPIKGVQIHDALGRLVLVQEFDLEMTELTIPTNQFLEGVYFLTVNTLDGSVTKKLLK